VRVAEPSTPRAAEAPERGPATNARGFDLHGLASIAVVDASAADLEAVARQLGLRETLLDRTPDITLRFVDRLELSGDLRLLGLGEAGYTDDAFVVLRGRHKSRVKVVVPFDRIGTGCEIVCERGLPAVPLLVPILNLAVLGNGALPLHASAFVHRGRGCVATGWTKGGKTEALLAFAAAGAAYVGDEWIYLSRDGACVYGIPEPVRVWDWHVNSLPGLRRRLGRSERMRLRALAGAQRVLATTRRLDRASALVARQRHVDVEPARLFSLRRASARFDTLFFVLTHDSPRVTVEPIDSLEVARRMSFSLAYERRDLVASYTQFRFAFPDAVSELLESAGERERGLLERMFADKPAYLVRHPYPVPLTELRDAMTLYAGVSA